MPALETGRAGFAVAYTARKLGPQANGAAKENLAGLRRASESETGIRPRGSAKQRNKTAAVAAAFSANGRSPSEQCRRKQPATDDKMLRTTNDQDGDEQEQRPARAALTKTWSGPSGGTSRRPQERPLWQPAEGLRWLRAPGERTFIKLSPGDGQRACRLSLAALLVVCFLMQNSRTIVPARCLIIYQAAAAATSANGPAVDAEPVSKTRTARRGELERPETHVRVGILLEESNHEQANMFIRTIKMINDQKDETIRQLLNMFYASKRAGASFGGKGAGAAAGHRASQGAAARGGAMTEAFYSEHLLFDAESSQQRQQQRVRQTAKTTKRQRPLQNQQQKQHDNHHHRREIKSADGASAGPTGESPHWRPSEDDQRRQLAPGGEVEAQGLSDQQQTRVGAVGGWAGLRAGEVETETVACAGAGAGPDLSINPGNAGSSQIGESEPPAYRDESAVKDADAIAGAEAAEHGRASATLQTCRPRQPITRRAREADSDADEVNASVRAKPNAFDIKLEPMIEFLQDKHSALEADEKVCQLIESGVYAIFSPIDGRSVQHVQSICDNLEIPYFELRPFIGGASSSHASNADSPAPAAMGPATATRLLPHEQIETQAKQTNLTGDAAPADGPVLVGSEQLNARSLPEALGGGKWRPEEEEQSGVLVHGGLAPNQLTDAAAISGGAIGGQLQSRQHLTRQPTNNKGSTRNRQLANQKQALAATANNKPEDLTLNLYPPSHLLNSAYIDMIYVLNWTSFAIVYEDGSSMIKLQSIFKEASAINSWTNRWRIRLFRYDPNGTPFDESQADHNKQRQKPPQTVSRQQHANSDQQTNQKVANTITNSTNGDKNNYSKQDGEHGDNIGGQEVSIIYQNGAPLSKRAHFGGTSAAALPGQDANQRKEPQAELFDSQEKSKATYRDVFWRVKMSGEHNILLDVKTENLYEALKQAQQVGCMTEEYSFLITSLDLHVIDLEDFKYSRTKITGFSLTQVTQRVAKEGTSKASTPLFDEKYLESLGIYPALATTEGGNGNHQQTNKMHGHRQPAKLTANLPPPPSRSSSNFDWLNEAQSNDQTRREMLQSSPASLGLLPTVDRNNEQKLFDFFLEQQQRNISRVRLSTSSAILHDSLILYMLGLHEMDPSGALIRQDPRQSQPVHCSLDSRPWMHGSSLVNYMKQMTFSGLTGQVSFDLRGLRNDFKLDVMGMAPNLQLVKIGEWHSKYAVDEQQQPRQWQQRIYDGVDSTLNRPKPPHPLHPEVEALSGDGRAREQANATLQQKATATASSVSSLDSVESYEELSSRYEDELKTYNKMLERGEQVYVPYKKRVSPNGALSVNSIIFERLYCEQADKIDTLIVTAKLSQPYFMLKETPNKLDGNDQFEGYAVDLIHELAKLVNFKYRWREVADKKYGSKEKLENGTIVWNGMIGEIVRGVADLAIVDLTITAQREEAVDFTLPFMNTGISILFKKPTTKVTTLFSFLSPFSSDVWAYVLAAYCGISAILFLVGHLSPYEWADPHPCRHSNLDSQLTVLKNQFSLLNSFWFTIGSLMQQGSDLTPRSMSTRTIAGIWYFFTLIMISSYTANLAAFLTVEKVVYPIENVRDLSNQQEIKYGCVESGSTCLFFHDSQIDTYKKIDETMQQHRTYVRSNDEGQKRVGEGKFAFFMESTTIEYIIERNCNLTQIGGLIDSKGYGLATAKKSRHKRPYRTLLNEGILHLQETGMLHVLKNRWWKEKRGGGTCTDDGKGGGVTELSLANVGGVFVVLLGGLGISFLVAIAEFIWRARRSGSNRDRMCDEMMNDLKFALACKSSTKPILARPGEGSSRRRPGGGGSGIGGNDSDSDLLKARLGLAPGRLRYASSQLIDRAGLARIQRPNVSSASSSPSRTHKYVESGETNDLVPVASRKPAGEKRCNPIPMQASLRRLSAGDSDSSLQCGGHFDALQSGPGTLVTHYSSSDRSTAMLLRQQQQQQQHVRNQNIGTHSTPFVDDRLIGAIYLSNPSLTNTMFRQHRTALQLAHDESLTRYLMSEQSDVENGMYADDANDDEDGLYEDEAEVGLEIESEDSTPALLLTANGGANAAASQNCALSSRPLSKTHDILALNTEHTLARRRMLYSQKTIDTG